MDNMYKNPTNRHYYVKQAHEDENGIPFYHIVQVRNNEWPVPGETLVYEHFDLLTVRDTIHNLIRMMPHEATYVEQLQHLAHFEMRHHTDCTCDEDGTNEFIYSKYSQICTYLEGMSKVAPTW